MKLLIAIIGSLFLLAVAAFSVFGFLATFEPTDSREQVARPVRKRILAQRHLAKLACFNLGGEFLSEANDHLVSAGAKAKHDGNQLQELFSIPRLNSE